MDTENSIRQSLTRRHFFGRAATGLGAAALGSLMNPKLFAEEAAAVAAVAPANRGILAQPHFPAKAKRVIYLVMAEGPSQLDIFDYKPNLAAMFDKDLPDSVRMGQRITTMTSGQARLPVAPSLFKFAQHGSSGAWFSELVPHIAGVADELAVVRSMHTDAINHDPAITFMQTGGELPGRPSMGAWLSYGLGSENQDLPAFVVLHSTWSSKAGAQALYSRLWGSGFLPSRHQGVLLRSGGDPVLYLSNPPGVDGATRREMLDRLAALNEKQYEATLDPEINTRIAQYEMAFRMQRSVPELANMADEPQHVLDMYGPDARTPGTFAYNCILARRLAERDVRFVQVYIRGWDQHNTLPARIREQCHDTDQPTAALILDLKQRGMLEDTLVVWGGEFGRTVYSQGTLTATDYGRDHHPFCYTMLMAGAGVKRGIVYGETDDFSYNVTKDPVHVHDLNATMLHLLGIDHKRLTYQFQGRDFRLTDVHGEVVTGLLS